MISHALICHTGLDSIRTTIFWNMVFDTYFLFIIFVFILGGEGSELSQVNFAVIINNSKLLAVVAESSVLGV